MSKNAKIGLALASLLVGYVLGALIKWPIGGTHNDGTVRVNASGSVMATPDQMVVDLSVRSKRASSAEALSSASASMTKVIAALDAAAIVKKDMSTTQIAVEPDITYEGKEGQKVSGYIARQSLRVTVRDLKKSSELLSKVSAAGGNDLIIENTSLKVSSKNSALAEARLKAIKAARAKAATYAEATGRSLGPVLRITESSGSNTVYSVRSAAADSTSGSNVPVEPGEAKIKVIVDATWRLN